MSEKLYTFDKSLELFQRARKVIPQGIYGHLAPVVAVPGQSPYYATHGKGARYWDVDGNEFIDYMCGYGPIVLGYAHAGVDAAAAAARERGMCFNHPTEYSVRLAEKLVDLVPTADWAFFAKNGADMTTFAIMAAREHTGRKKILTFKGGYHGTHPWCGTAHAGYIEEDRMHIHGLPYNDLAAVRAAFDRWPGEVAGIIATPYHHPAFADNAMPAPDWWSGLRELCDRFGAVLIMDDVRAGFRLSLRGSAEYFGARPDLIAFCKAIANGYPLSALVGVDALRVTVSKIYMTGSYWAGPDAQAAGLATLEYLEKEGGIETMRVMGERLMRGLNQLATTHGLKVNVTGHPSMLNMTFANEKDFKRMQLWSAECMKRGVFFHPHHNWFVCAAHTATDIDQSLDVADKAFAIVKQRFGG